MADLDEGQVKFMKKTQQVVKARDDEIRQLRHTYKYEQPLYWSGQLYTEDFDKSPVRVVEVEWLGFANLEPTTCQWTPYLTDSFVLLLRLSRDPGSDWAVGTGYLLWRRSGHLSQTDT